MNILEKDKEFVWHPYSHLTLTENMISIVKGEGVYLVDEQGNKYIDAISSWWVNLFGHSHPFLKQRMMEQFEELEHCIFAQFTHKPAVDLAQKLLEFCGFSFGKIFYSDNGSTAVEVALKMSMQYHNIKQDNRKKIVILENAYHGDTFGAMSVSGRSKFNLPFNEYLFEVETIPAPNSENIAQTLDYFLATKNEILCFIYEPTLQGVAGMNMYDIDSLRQLLLFCKENEILTIADEVLTGFYRTGKKIASLHTGVKGDLICLSKGLTGGTMAMGVTLVSPHIAEVFETSNVEDTFFHGHSYTANPLACSCALATLELLPDYIERIESISQRHQQMIPVFENFGYFENIRSLGTVLAMDVKTDKKTNYFSEIRNKLYTHFLDSGVLLRPLGNVLYIMPPYCISDSQLDKVYDSIIQLDYFNLIKE